MDAGKCPAKSGVMNHLFRSDRCGLGGSGDPVDGTDACCQVHDSCYGDIMNNRTRFLACSPYFAFYDCDFDTATELPYCISKQDSCSYRVCECDRIATTCFKHHRDAFDKSLKCPNQIRAK
jgi:secretory phospholipase A2